MVYLVKKENQALADKIMSAIRQSPEQAMEALHRAEDGLRAILGGGEQADKLLMPGHKYGVLGLTPNGYIWKADQMVTVHPKPILLEFQYIGSDGGELWGNGYTGEDVLRGGTGNGWYSHYPVKSETVFFEL